MKRALAVLLFVWLVAPAAPAAPPDDPIPDRPEKIPVKPLDWAPPDPAKHRFGRGGFGSPVVYVVNDPSLPLVEVSVHFPVGSAGDPLAEMGTDLLVRGGAGDESGDALRRRVDGMGGRLSVDSGRERGSVSIQVLSRDLDAAVDILVQVLLHPAYREEEIARYRGERHDAFARRDDDIGAYTARSFREMVLGKDHPFAWSARPEMFDAIGHDDLAAWARQVFGDGPLVITLAGRVPDVPGTLDRLFAAFGRKLVARAGPLPVKTNPVPATRVLTVLDRPGATQGNVMIGRPGIAEDDPDWIPMLVMNYVLGGSGFPSRITKRVRSDEGLAYSVGSRLDAGDHVAGTYHVSFQTRTEMVRRAITIVMEELAAIAKDGVTDAELERAKQALIERQPDGFDTPEDTAGAFADLELSGRPLDWYATWRDRVAKVTKADVLRVAREHGISPDHCVVLVVGDAAALGDLGDGR